MAGFGNDVFARWSYIQGTLFPWLREQLDPVTAALEQLIIVLDTIGLAACRRRRATDAAASPRTAAPWRGLLSPKRCWACRPQRR